MDAKLNHSDLSALLAKNTNMSGAKADTFTKAFFDVIIEGLEKDALVKINGLGTFKITDVASRGSVNVNTGEKIEIKGHKKPVFLPAENLKEKVNKPFAVFAPVEIDDSYIDEGEKPFVDEPENLEEGGAEEKETVEVAAVATETSAEEENIAHPLREESPVVASKEAAPANNETIADNDCVETTGKRLKNRIMFLVVAALVALAAIFAPSLLPLFTSEKNHTEEPVAIPLASDTTTIADTKTVLVDSTASVQPTPPEPYEFKMLDELAAKSVGSVGIGDTLLYKADGVEEKHIVAENETLTRIALKYYGDKRLWPYIVQYNKISNPNGLCKGMELEIPRLIPAECKE